MQKKETHHLQKRASGQEYILVPRRLRLSSLSLRHHRKMLFPNTIVIRITTLTVWSGMQVVQLWWLIIDPLISILLELYIWNTKQYHNCESATAKLNYIFVGKKNMAKHIKTLLDEVSKKTALRACKLETHDHELQHAPATIKPRKIPSYLPLYCLFDRDPYNSLLQSQYNWVV